MSVETGRAAAHAEPAAVPVVLATAARFSFQVLIVLIPFRARLVLHPIRIESLYSDFTDYILFASDVFALLTLLLWAAQLIVLRRRPATGPWFVTWPLAGVLVIALISAFDSAAPAISWYHVARLAGLFGLYLFAVNTIESLETLIVPVAVMVAVQSVVAVAQFLLQRSTGLSFLGELALDPGMAGVSIVWAPGIYSLRSYGLSDHPNILGGCLALGLILLLAAFARMPSRQRIVLFGVIVLGTLGLLYTFSRSAWLALAAGGLIVWITTWRFDRAGARQLFTLGMTAALVLLPFLLATAPYLGSRLGIGTEVRITDPELLSPENRSLAERAQLFAVANRMFVENPVTGVGLGAFSIALIEQLPDFEFDYQPVHFVLLLVAAEIGLLGALTYSLAASFPWVALWLARIDRSSSPDLYGASAALAGVTVIGLFDYYPWFLPPGRLWHWIILGIWAAWYERRKLRHV
ncbi:MAG TPA: O-antigen ligase family protein [Anaerolineales bacterium]|nr:O-antigen ligase family protein [Anaerolineales bacterium]